MNMFTKLIINLNFKSLKNDCKVLPGSKATDR